ncbi:MAG: prepilin peptidase [Burkholderiales bacterium]
MYFLIATSPHVLLAALLAIAVAADIRFRRVPNELVLSGIVLAVAAHALVLKMDAVPLAGPAWWSPLAGLAVGFALLLPLYLLRATGAGDVKLMAMVGTFVGASTVLAATLYTLLAGGLLSLVFMLGRGVAAQTIANVRFMLTDWAQRAISGQGARFAPLQTTAARLPYAVAIALGTGAALLWPLQPMLNGAAR